MQIGIKKQKVMEYPVKAGFRPGIPVVPRPVNFLFINGGMGDYICWMQAILWLVDHATWIQGRVVGPSYFRELAEHWLQGSSWTFHDYEYLKEDNANRTPVRGPMYLQYESLNATGAHLLDCGFSYFACQNPPPGPTPEKPEGWNHYPRFETLPRFAGLPERYCVLTTGKTSPSRHVPGEYWNHVIDHVVERGYTPVFLGSSVMSVGGGKDAKIQDVRTTFDEGVNYAKGIDLRNKTSLLEAASIIQRAAFVVGHDNGLLHLAGCTETPIIFGYNVASPLHRRPRRAKGRIYDVTLTPKELSCIHCQSRTNFVIGFVFHTCFYKENGRVKGYKENACIDLMFADRAKRWTDAIDQAIAEAT